MIIEALAGVAASFVGTVLGALPSVPVPSFISDGSGAIGTVMGAAAGLGNWVPLGLFVVSVGVVVAAMVAGMGIKVARIVASFLTLGGGGAG